MKGIMKFWIKMAISLAMQKMDNLLNEMCGNMHGLLETMSNVPTFGTEVIFLQ
jgi:hypothetical protein